MSQSGLQYNLCVFPLIFFSDFRSRQVGESSDLSSAKPVQSDCVQLISPRNHTSGVGNLQSSVMKSQVRKTINSSS